LRTFGYKVNNELFEHHSWYFRNALVRANYKNHTKNIHATNEFLLRFFGNLLLGENNTLQNRELHVNYANTVKTQNDTVFSLVKQNKNITATEISERLNISLSTVKRNIKDLKEQGIIKRTGSDKTGYWKIIEK
jgi:predicted HTH transcriptional regulator